MTRPARALVDAHALQHNLKEVRRLAPQSRVMAVVKADAYGHGLAWAASVLQGADGFGVASAEEGIALRESGVTQPICLLEGFFDAAELPALIEYRLGSVIHHEGQLRAVKQAGAFGGGRLDVWLKVDTGMHRIGFPPAEVPAALMHLRTCPAVNVIRMISHLASADVVDDPTTARQIESFQAVTADLNLERSLANSAGLLAWPESHLDWVRPGIMLYGVSPFADRNGLDLRLQPVMTLESALIAINRLHRGDAIGYGGTWVCPEDMPVGVVAMGYGDGYPRHAPTGTPVLVNGQPAPLIGRVSMDMVTVDLRAQPQAQVGDPVVLWGRGLPVEGLARRAGTIGYELLCRVSPRVARVPGGTG